MPTLGLDLVEEILELKRTRHAVIFAWKAICDMFAVKWLPSRQIQIRSRRES